MLKFLKQLLLFLFLFSLFCLSGLLFPPTPRASKSLLAAGVMKDSLMSNVNPPRLLLIGGSNLSFGLNSQIIKDSLGLNPVNTGIHAAIGLIYMMDNALQYVREGDIVVLIPEYEEFYDGFAYGSEELLRTILDGNRSNIRLLHFRQFLNIIPYLPNYTMSKFRLKEYTNVSETKHYSVNSFNDFGDVSSHWNEKSETFKPANPLNGKLNLTVIKEMKMFQSEIESKNAQLYVSFPVFQEQSYMNSRIQIETIEALLHEKEFPIIGSPERYLFPDSLLFNTPAHLIKSGVDQRTTFLIEDLSSVL